MIKAEDIKKYVEEYFEIPDLNERKYRRTARYRRVFYILCDRYAYISLAGIAKMVDRDYHAVYSATHNNVHIVMNDPVLYKCIKDFENVYKFLVDDNVIAETPYNIYKALQQQHTLNETLKQELLKYKLEEVCGIGK